MTCMPASRHLPAPLRTSTRISHITFQGPWPGMARRQLPPRTPQPLNRIRRYGRIVVLPYMHHDPAHQVKLGVFLTVTGDVALEFVPPPVTVVFRENTVVRARMPETPIHEHGQPCGRECDVRPTGKPWMIDPEPEATAVQLPADQYLRTS